MQVSGQRKTIIVEYKNKSEFDSEFVAALRELGIDSQQLEAKPKNKITDYLNEIFFQTCSVVGVQPNLKLIRDAENKFTVNYFQTFGDVFDIRFSLDRVYNLDKKIYSSKLTISSKRKKGYTLRDYDNSQIPLIQHLLGITIQAAITS